MRFARLSFFCSFPSLTCERRRARLLSVVSVSQVRPMRSDEGRGGAFPSFFFFSKTQMYLS